MEVETKVCADFLAKFFLVSGLDSDVAIAAIGLALDYPTLRDVNLKVLEVKSNRTSLELFLLLFGCCFLFFSNYFFSLSCAVNFCSVSVCVTPQLANDTTAITASTFMKFFFVFC